MENNNDNLNKKMLEFQMKVSAIKKNKVNPHFKNSYSDINEILSEIKPLLSECKLFLSQPILDGFQYSIITDVETGEQISSQIALPINLQPQPMGAAITYFRRYSLVTLLCLETEEDNDGNNTTPPQTPTTPQTPSPENWLNVTDKDGNLTKHYANVLDAIEKGKITSLDQVKSVYKLSKETQQQLLKDLQANGN